MSRESRKKKQRCSCFSFRWLDVAFSKIGNRAGKEDGEIGHNLGLILRHAVIMVPRIHPSKGSWQYGVQRKRINLSRELGTY